MSGDGWVKAPGRTEEKRLLLWMRGRSHHFRKVIWGLVMSNPIVVLYNIHLLMSECTIANCFRRCARDAIAYVTINIQITPLTTKSNFNKANPSSNRYLQKQVIFKVLRITHFS